MFSVHFLQQLRCGWHLAYLRRAWARALCCLLAFQKNLQGFSLIDGTQIVLSLAFMKHHSILCMCVCAVCVCAVCVHAHMQVCMCPCMFASMCGFVCVCACTRACVCMPITRRSILKARCWLSADSDLETRLGRQWGVVESVPGWNQML